MLASYETAKSANTDVRQKVGMGFCEVFISGNSFVYIVGLALFYAWNLTDIYVQPIAGATSGVETIVWIPTLVSSLCNVLGYIAIAVFLFRTKRLKFIALAASFVAGACCVLALRGGGFACLSGHQSCVRSLRDRHVGIGIQRARASSYNCLHLGILSRRLRCIFGC